MEIHEITLKGKPAFVCLGDHPSGVGHSVSYRQGRNVWADFILGGAFNFRRPFVLANAVRLEIDTDDLKPLIDYYQENSQQMILPLKEREIETFENESKDDRFRHYYHLPQTGESGRNLAVFALALHIMIHVAPELWILDAEGNVVQPVSFNQEPTENDFEVAVSVVDGIEPFIYSKGGDLQLPGSWQASNILTYNENERENARIFVLDSAGTIGTALAKFANRNADSGS